MEQLQAAVKGKPGAVGAASSTGASSAAEQQLQHVPPVPEEEGVFSVAPEDAERWARVQHRRETGSMAENA